VQLVDPLPAEQLVDRSRAYALTHSSRRLLERLGLWYQLAAELTPFQRLELCDRAIGRSVPFRGGDLTHLSRHLSPRLSCSSGETAVGWILQHRPLMEVLLQAIHSTPAIEPSLGSRGPLPADPAASPSALDLLVAADGHHSPTRRAAGLREHGFAYRQGCLTVQVRLRGSAPDQAWELFRPEGPFAVLPLGGDAFQLVWSAPLARLQRLQDLEGPAFLDALSAALPESLQVEVLLDQPRAWPVGLAMAWPLRRGRLVLLGEAAHRCHPVGGQGLNLCWRDVAVLAELAEACASGRFRPSDLPARYARRRALDILLVLLFTDALVRLFSNRLAPLLPLRRLALAVLQRSPALRRLSLRLMTEGPWRLRSA
jgi:2-octaprenyl-6-methoxyphenol hydroxylase